MAFPTTKASTSPRTASALLLLGALVIAWGRPAAAEDWRHLLLEGEPASQAQWGQRYEHGEGVAQNLDRAVRLYCAAARRGYTDAQYRLGWLYANGRGMERDDDLAAAWFRLAADNGDTHARRMLTRLDVDAEPKPPLCMSPGHSEPILGFDLEHPRRADIEAAVEYLAPGYGLDPALVTAVIDAESGFDPRARSPKGAVGLMQLMPQTATRFGVDDRLDPLENLKGGMAYLRWLLERFDGNVALALAGYNAGENAVKRYGGIPPYAETRTYVRRITRRYTHPTHPLAPQKTADATELLAGGDSPS